ncbi:MAG TPA: DUF1640 domain-containing protein [Xylella sp.]
MALVGFDTLNFANQLKNAGIPPAHAEAQAEALAGVMEANRQELATKADLRELELQLEAKMDKGFAEIKGQMLLLLKWMLGVLVAGVATLVAKAFF